ncbi:MAG: WS/DGAT domain-containing protein [Microthrixaceae bacterium]|nr:WS/DGAT domain-containing protein [Microthrixaceae bacterium]
MADGEGTPLEYMSDFEALMWNLEKSPALSNTFANVTILDRPPDKDRFLDKMAVAVTKVPKLRQRPVEPAGALSNPAWADDPDFDLHHHLRWVNLGNGATTRDLYDYVATLTSQPFDRERPLWDFTIIEGLQGGASAMLQRMHHTITDGEGGIRLSVAFLDLERSPDQPSGDTEPAADTSDTGGEASADDASGDASTGDASSESATVDRGEGEPTESSRITEFVGALTDSLRQRGAQVVDAIGAAGSFITNPADAAELTLSAGRQAQVLTRCSPLWTQRTLDRWFGTTSLELAAVKDASHRLGGTVNDFFVTGAASAAGAYHRAKGAEVDQLRMSMPVSVRGTDPEARHADPMAGGNAFSPTQVLLPTGEIPATERFTEVHERLSATRRTCTGGAGRVAAVINLLPTAALLATGERATAGIDFVCSNVRAAPFDLYMGGALLEANYPVGPLAGTPFNLTTMSYCGTLWLGLHVDSGRWTTRNCC